MERKKLDVEQQFQMLVDSKLYREQLKLMWDRAEKAAQEKEEEKALRH